MWPYHPELLARAVPRYTSFPTAAEFSDALGAEEGAAAIGAAQGPVSLYLHIPFCEQICWYCGCNTGAANRAQRLGAYLDALDEEVDAVAAMLPVTSPVEHIAFGGGSPNAIEPLAFVRLLDHVVTRFGARNARVSVELDPRGIDERWVHALGAAGISHVSMGVQTFSPDIQARIGRVQPAEQIGAATAGLRQSGVTSINFDLMYGLPGQTISDIDDSVSRTIDMAPDRIALFGYAHVPHLLPRQRRIDATALPDQAARFAMAMRGHIRLTQAGYVPVGFDHYALPHDPLARATGDGSLRRNFQGFTDDGSQWLIGMGASAISCFPDRIIQNQKNNGHYRAAVSDHGVAGARGVWRTRDDRERAMVIEDILCLRAADAGAIMSPCEIAQMLDPFVAHGLVRVDGTQVMPTAVSAPYARSMAALFDPYRGVSQHQFSNAV